MKRKTEEKIRGLTQAWRDLAKILGEYRKRSDHSETLVADLEKTLKLYEKSVFQTVVEG
jgi:hypothetical protein